MSEETAGGDWPCEACGVPMLLCFSSFTRGGGPCCADCTKHGFSITDRGRAAVGAMEDGFSYEDALTLHGKQDER